MKKANTLIVAFLSMVLFTISSNSQNFNLNNQSSSITVSGTSSLHDWDVIAESFSGTLKLKDVSTANIEALKVKVISESLKSGKKGMDKNTYKALNTDKYKNISFKLEEVNSLKKIDDSTFEIKLKASITITGVTKVIPIKILFSSIEKDAINVTGSCTFKMTDFGVEPPTALFGTIKTGDQITIKFNANFLKE